MPETHLIAPARRRVIALTLVAGAALGLLTTAGLTTAAPAAADVSGRSVVTDRSALRADLAATAAAVEDGRSVVAKAAATVTKVKRSGFDLDSATIDTTGLAKSLNDLSDEDAVGDARATLTANTIVETEIVEADTSALRDRLDDAIAEKKAAEAKKEAAEAKKKAEKKAAAEAEAQAAALESANTPDGARSVAAKIAASEYGWGEGEFSCLDSLWMKESGWDYQAYNPSGATGIPQALPGDKMATFGSDWASNATTQIKWGLDYISSVYGTPCAAWGHSQSVNWY
ncbi:phospholipase [Microbacterium sp.]|uniref:aggregation-promoting factor C-terminal-like domain-containing protein n=1 Tax=Microbacterium sp. TaxID=51671 RepID=UPI003F9B0E56